MACHTTCQEYKDWKVAHDLKVAEIEKREQPKNEVLSYKAKFYERYFKKTRWNKK